MMRRRFLATSFAAGASAAFAAAPEPLSVAIIGHTGRGNYGHDLDTLWLDLPQTKVVAVADADEKGRSKAQQRLKVERGFASYREMLAAVKPDLVSIALRHVDQHHDMIVAAVEAGVKGIYIEKPFCRDLVEADSILAALEKSHTKLAVAHRLRYHPVLPVLKQLIGDGEIGQVLEIRTRGKEDHRGGPLDFWVLGSHLVNLAVYFTGDPTACTATILQDGRPISKADLVQGDEGIGLIAGDEIHARYETANGIPIFYDCLRKVGVREASFGVQIIGNQGVIDLRLDVDHHTKEQPIAHLIRGCPHLPPKTARPWVPITSAGIDKPEPIADMSKLVRWHHAAIHDLIAAIQENRDPLCSAKDGRLTVEMIFAVFESHCQNGARVPFPLEVKANPFSLL